MNHFKPICSTMIISTSFLVMGCTVNSKLSQTPALFETKADAAKAAKNFNCTGAHRMGNKWMPCKSHADHEEGGKDEAHKGHHHHH